MELILISFLAGVLTVGSPCVFTLLPVVLSGGLSVHQRLRPLVVIGALCVSIFVFTLLLKASTLFITFPDYFWKLFASLLIAGYGYTALFPEVWDKIAIRLGISAKANETINNTSQKSGLWGAALVGAALGPVFSSCSPTYALILATVLPVNFASGLLNLVAYCMGLAAILLIISLFGQAAIAKLRWLADPAGLFKKHLGLLLILIGFMILTGLDKQLETTLVERGANLGNIELELINVGN